MTVLALEDELHALVGGIYDAAFDPDAVPAMLRRMCTVTESTSGILGFHQDHRFVRAVYQGIDPAWEPLRRAFDHQNLYIKRSHLAPVGRAVLGEDLASPAEWQRLELFHEVFRPAGTVHLLGMLLAEDETSLVEISLWRGETCEPHGDRELDIADQLAPHLQRAFAMARSLQAVELRVIGLEQALRRLSLGCLLVDGAGRLVFANSIAEEVLRWNRPLRLRGGRVVADTAANQRRWQALLGRFAPHGGLVEGTATALDKQDGQALRLLAVPVGPARSEILGLAPPAHALGLVVMGDLVRPSDGAADVLRRLFGLTAAEAGLAIALLGGESLQGYANQQGRSLNTMKTHLKAVFDKTGASRQSDLIRRLAALAMLVH